MWATPFQIAHPCLFHALAFQALYHGRLGLLPRFYCLPPSLACFCFWYGFMTDAAISGFVGYSLANCLPCNVFFKPWRTVPRSHKRECGPLPFRLPRFVLCSGRGFRFARMCLAACHIVVVVVVFFFFFFFFVLCSDCNLFCNSSRRSWPPRSQVDYWRFQPRCTAMKTPSQNGVVANGVPPRHLTQLMPWVIAIPDFTSFASMQFGASQCCVIPTMPALWEVARQVPPSLLTCHLPGILNRCPVKCMPHLDWLKLYVI